MLGIKGRGPWWSKGDGDALIGVFADGFSKVIAATAIMTYTIKVPGEIIYKNILPSIGLTIFGLNLLFTLYARYLNYKEGRDDNVALPTGLHATRVFTWLFAIMLPVYIGTGDGVLAWKVGVVANLISSVIFIITGYASDWLQKTIPAPALFGTLAGGAVAFLGVNILSKMFNTPIVAFVALFALLIPYMAKIETKIPGPVISIILGTVAAWVMGVKNVDGLKASMANATIQLPKLTLDVFSFDYGALTPYLAIVLIFTIHGAINSLMGIKQAHSVNDNIDAKNSILVIGLVNIISCLFGNPFPLGVFWGHNTWKELKAGSGYSLAVGAIYAILCFSGLVAIVNGLVPAEATLPMLLFIALSSTTQVFNVTDVKYYGVLTLTIVLSLMEIMLSKVMGAVKATAKIVGGPVPTLKLLEKGGVDSFGYFYLGNGALFISIIWASIVIYIIDKDWKKATIASLAGALFTFFGMIHSANPGVMVNMPLVICYVVLGVIMTMFKIKGGCNE
ncbi:MAG: hypothetical protein ACRC92_04610 [Peptostreptococcaceae bacterium]